MPTPSTVSFPSATLDLGETYTITVNRYSTTYKHTIVISASTPPSAANEIGRLTNVEGSVQWTVPDSSEVLAFFSTTSAVLNNVLVRCYTYDSMGAYVGNTDTYITLRIPNTSDFAPHISASSTISPTGGYANYISQTNAIRFAVSATAKNNASIASYYYGISTEEGNAQGAYSTSANYDLPLIISGHATVAVTVTDTRGLYRTYRFNAIDIFGLTLPSLLPYPNDSAVYCKRVKLDGTEADDGGYVRVKLSRSFGYIDTDNEGCEVTYEIAENTATPSWSSPITLISSSDTDNPKSYDNLSSISSFTTDASKNYIVRLTATDEIGNESVLTFNIPAEGVTFHLANDGKGVGIGKYSSGGNKLEVAYDTYLEGDLYLGGHKLVASGSDGGWTYRKYADGKVEAHRVITYDQQYAFGSGGAVVRTGWHLYKCPDLGNNGEETISLPSINGVPLFSATPAISVDADHLMIVVISDASNTEIKYYLATEGVEAAYPPSGQEITVHFYCTL